MREIRMSAPKVAPRLSWSGTDLMVYCMSLVIIGDHKGLAEAIRYLYDHPDIAQQMGTNGRQWALKKFTEQACAEGVLAPQIMGTARHRAQSAACCRKLASACQPATDLPPGASNEAGRGTALALPWCLA